MIVRAQQQCHAHRVPSGTIDTDGYYWDNPDAITYLTGLESAVTHTRLLDDFYAPSSAQVTAIRLAKRSNHRDRFAADYCTKGDWPGYRIANDDQHQRIDRQLSHFSTDRAPRTPHPLSTFAQRAHDALKLLAAICDDDHREQFRRTERRMADALAHPV